MNNIPKLKIYNTVSVNTKGQIVLPAEVRKTMNIQNGDSLTIIGIDDGFAGIIKTDRLNEFVSNMLSHSQDMSGLQIFMQDSAHSLTSDDKESNKKSK